MKKYNVELVEERLKVGDWLISPRLDTIIDSTISPELCRLIGYFCEGEYYVRFTFNGNKLIHLLNELNLVNTSKFKKKIQ